MEEEGRVSLHTPQPFRLMWQGRHQLGGLHHRHHVGGGEGRVSLHPPPSWCILMGSAGRQRQGVRMRIRITPGLRSVHTLSHMGGRSYT